MVRGLALVLMPENEWENEWAYSNPHWQKIATSRKMKKKEHHLVFIFIFIGGSIDVCR